MIKTKRFSLITFSFLIGLFFFTIIGTNEAKAVGPVIVPGCCTTEEGGGECIGCPDGETCFASSLFCPGSFTTKGACMNDGQGAMCVDAEPTDGCCVIAEGQCTEETDIESCFLGTPGGPEIFVSGATCSVVPQCTVTRNVPTISNWGLIALAGVFILAAIWGISRRKNMA